MRASVMAFSRFAGPLCSGLLDGGENDGARTTDQAHRSLNLLRYLRLRRQFHALVPIILELVAQHLAAIVLRQLRDEEDPLGILRRRQLRAAVVRHRGLGQARARPWHDVADDLLAVDLVGHADRRGIGDAGVLEQHRVDLERCDVDAAADDEILSAAGDAYEAVVVHDREVAGLDALAADHVDRAVLEQIADTAVRASNAHLALDIGRTRPSLAIDDRELLMQRGYADRAHPVPVVSVAADPAGLRHPVHLQELDAVHP